MRPDQFPFTTFNFFVRFLRNGNALCEGAFSECDGLELSFDVKTIREGGNNRTQIHLPGPVSYGQLSLKRGMTHDFGLWTWFEDTHTNRSLRVEGEIDIWRSERLVNAAAPPVARFRLGRCLPVKLKAPSLNAKEGGVAIEEMQVAYETMTPVITGRTA